MLVLGDSVVVRGPAGSAVRHHRDGTTRTYARDGHVIVALDEGSDTVVTSDGASIWIWEQGLDAQGTDVKRILERLPRPYPPDAHSHVERIAAGAWRAESVDRAVNVAPQKPYVRRNHVPSPYGPLPTVVFGLDAKQLIVGQLGHFDESHDDEPRYRSIACTPPGDSTIREERLFVWCAHTHESFAAVVGLPEDRVALGEPGAVEIAFDASPPSRAVLPDVVASEVRSAHLVRPDGTHGWRAVLAFRHYIATFELRRGAITTNAVSACGDDESLLGADAEARPIVRSGRDLFLVHADGTRRPLASNLEGELGVSADGRVLVHRTNGGGFAWIDLA